MGPPILAGIGAIWVLRAAVRSTVPPLHRLISPLLLGPCLGLYVAFAQAGQPLDLPPAPLDLCARARRTRAPVHSACRSPPRGCGRRELEQRARAHVTVLREVVRRQTRELLRQWREANNR